MSMLSGRCRFFTARWGGFLVLCLFVAFLASLAVPNYAGSYHRSKTPVIVNNLQQLDGAVQYWGIEHRQTGAVVVTWENIAPYLKIPVKPVAGEVYILKDLMHSPEAVLTRKLDEKPKGTVLRLGTNGVLEIILPKP
jgi:hypothetical protein